jgi:peptidylprolyl isomerase
MRSFALLLLLFLAACDFAGDDPEVIIQEIEVGDGVVIASASTVDRAMTVRFDVEARVLDGCTFLDDKRPITVGGGQIIRGLDEGLVGMRIGGTRVITVPSALAWGSRGQQYPGTCSVPGDATVVFEVTALEMVNYVQTDIEVGTGEEATPGRSATVTYEGRLDDGSIFDSGSYVFTVGAGSVVAGFDRAARGMRVGGTREVSFPPTLGYAAAARHPLQWEVLHFTITLDAVN